MPRLAPSLVVLGTLVGCAPTGVSTRALHVVDGDLVYSRPASSRAYEAYLRARLALEASPPRLDEARDHIRQALRYDPRAPQLWTTRAEIEWRGGDVDTALAACRRALTLSPEYPPARSLLAQLEGGSGASASVTRAGGS